MLKNIVVLIGAGEMGGVFARGLLRSGYPLYPVVRGMNIEEAARAVGSPAAVVVAVRENELTAVLEKIPAAWKEPVVLLQNELLPRDWKAKGFNNPTVISVWFEKKPGQDFKIIISSPVFGPLAELVRSALESLKIPVRVLQTEEELLFELILKNVYILTINIAGLQVGGTVEELWKKEEALAKAVAQDVMDVQFWLAGREFNRTRIIEKMAEAFAGDGQHKCLGRTAQERLTRIIGQADEAGLAVRTLREIYLKNETQNPKL